MRSVLCYGDSNTHGTIPAGPPFSRYSYDQRWPGVLSATLGPEWLVIEEGLGGRTTVSDDPVEGIEKNGRHHLKPCLDSHKPLDLVIIMLGTNDLKARFNKTAHEIALGVGALVSDVKTMMVGPQGAVPQILIVCPPPTTDDLKEWAQSFLGAPEKSQALAGEYERVAVAQDVHFLDAGTVVSSCPDDGFHLDAKAHRDLGRAIAAKITALDWPAV